MWFCAQSCNVARTLIHVEIHSHRTGLWCQLAAVSGSSFSFSSSRRVSLAPTLINQIITPLWQPSNNTAINSGSQDVVVVHTGPHSVTFRDFDLKSAAKIAVKKNYWRIVGEMCEPKYVYRRLLWFPLFGDTRHNYKIVTKWSEVQRSRNLSEKIDILQFEANWAILVHDASNEQLRYSHDVRPSICLSGTGVHCDHTVHFSADLSLWLDSPMFRAPDNKACPPTPSRLFPIAPRTEVWYGCAN